MLQHSTSIVPFSMLTGVVARSGREAAESGRNLGVWQLENKVQRFHIGLSCLSVFVFLYSVRDLEYGHLPPVSSYYDYVHRMAAP